MGTLLQLATSLLADRWLIAAVPASAQQPSARRQAGRQAKRGARGSRAPGCPLLLHQRLKALCSPHSPTPSVTLNRLQLVYEITWSCPWFRHYARALFNSINLCKCVINKQHRNGNTSSRDAVSLRCHGIQSPLHLCSNSRSKCNSTINNSSNSPSITPACQTPVLMACRQVPTEATRTMSLLLRTALVASRPNPEWINSNNSRSNSSTMVYLL
jgi:hypothetical protein